MKTCVTLVMEEFHDIAAVAVNGRSPEATERRGHAPTQSHIIMPIAPKLTADWIDLSNNGRNELMSPEILRNTCYEQYPACDHMIHTYYNTCCWDTHRKEFCKQLH